MQITVSNDIFPTHYWTLPLRKSCTYQTVFGKFAAVYARNRFKPITIEKIEILWLTGKPFSGQSQENVTPDAWWGQKLWFLLVFEFRTRWRHVKTVYMQYANIYNTKHSAKQEFGKYLMSLLAETKRRVIPATKLKFFTSTWQFLLYKRLMPQKHYP